MLATSLLVLAGPILPASAAGPNLAAGKTVTASSFADVYGAGNANDGNQNTYWESANNAFPQWIQVDLGSAVSVNQVVLKVPAPSAWATRTETLSVLTGTSSPPATTAVGSAGYTFNPATGNTVTINFTATTARYIRLNITGNTGWPAGQISEFEVYGPVTGGDVTPPSAPSNLSYTEPASGQIKLTWGASTDDVGVTGYDVYANNALRGSVAGNVLTYTDTQPTTATVSYFVKAKDASGKQSGNSNTVTRNGSGGTGGGTNLAVGKSVTASGSVFTFVPGNAVDDNVATYWEGASGAYPSTLTVPLGANADINRVVIKLNPDNAWGQRTQTIEILGREQSATGFTSLSGPTPYVFNPGSGNSVTIPVSARVADVQLKITSNTGAPAGQAAEFQVFGTPAPNPDLTVTGLSSSPANPVETDAVTLSATVKNQGSANSGATNVNFYFGTTKVGTASVGALAAGASTTVTANIGPRDAGTYALSAKVDEANSVIEQNETNNSFASSTSVVVRPVDSSDLVPTASWTPSNPASGNVVTFSVALKNQGTVASAGGAHAITLTVTNDSGTVVRTLTSSYSGAIAAGATTSPVNLGTWTAANGKYTVKTVLANDTNELPVKQGNNTLSQPFFVGRGANMPYDTYEAESGVVGGGAQVVGPSRDIGTLAGEASGRRAVTLNSTGSYVEFTTKASTNTLVTRFSIPDSAGGGGINSTLNIYVNGTFLKPINLTSKYAWLYGNETGPQNSPAAGPRHIYDEANVLLGTTVPAGSTIRLQKDAANTTNYAIDFIDLEQVSPIANPDAAHYAVPTGFSHQDVQNALDRARQDANLVGVYLPTGDYQTTGKFNVYGKALKIVGAGPWYTRFYAPTTQDNTDVGFDAQSSANGSSFSGFAYFGNYVTRIDGPGKVFNWSNVANMTIDNVWVEHTVCMYWGANTDNVTIKNSRIRDTFADGVNMTNGSTGNLVSNNEARTTGDDSFALFSAIDAGGADEINNVYENLTAILPWRAAGVAVYGGYANTFKNIYIADTLTYSGITISSLDFGYPMNGFGASPPTTFDNISIVRAGGHFWGAQTFPGIWIFSASKVFQGIRVSNVDIVDPTYSGIMFQTNYVGNQPQNPVTDTILTNVSITGAQKSGDAFDAKSGFGIWVNEMPEAGQGPAVGSATFNHLTMSNNAQNIKNTTSTFTIVQNP
ncbi:CARDB domain-containing protein [Planotetraspora mira]|uniref:Glycosyl hydrolase n=1 Tax=Planotetraspora mira TaxID=58121 RepID=A0A8J3TTJ0_9ACTN|nr:CARDB domain-containing protein [Planotetraspora mira]GII31092.1 glycosyl hydrolase [Planotetraspora mira]